MFKTLHIVYSTYQYLDLFCSGWAHLPPYLLKIFACFRFQAFGHALCLPFGFWLFHPFLKAQLCNEISLPFLSAPLALINIIIVFIIIITIILKPMCNIPEIVINVLCTFNH